jgi:hypothetical protein
MIIRVITRHVYAVDRSRKTSTAVDEIRLQVSRMSKKGKNRRFPHHATRKNPRKSEKKI